MCMDSLIEIGHFSPYFTFLYLLLLCINDSRYFVIFVISLIDYGLIGPYEKLLAIQLNVDSPRPAYPRYNGMPSGHTQLMWLLFTYFSVRNDTFHTYLFGILAILTSYQRVYSGMHSKIQVFVGLILGIFMGNIWSCVIPMEKRRGK